MGVAMLDGKAVYWGALILAICANVAANVSLKLAMSHNIEGTIALKLVHALGQVSFWLGCFFSAVLLLSYLTAIRSLPLSTAYPVVTGAALVLLSLVDRFYFGHAIEPAKVFGLALVAAGVAIVSLSSN